MSLGDKIRTAREASGLTMEELGKRCGTTKQTIYKYETGKITNIPLDRLEMIADSVGVTAATLMGWDNKQTQSDSGFRGENHEPLSVGENKQIMARNIKKYMEKKGVSNQMLCDDLGFKYTTFLDWIKGVTYPRIGKIEAMAQYFGCEKSDLIEEKSELTEEGELPKSVTELMQFIKSFSEDEANSLLAYLKATHKPK